MRLVLLNSRNPTISEIVSEAREHGIPDFLFSATTRSDVICACRLRNLSVRDGRVLLGPDGLANLAFGLSLARKFIS